MPSHSLRPGTTRSCKVDDIIVSAFWEAATTWTMEHPFQFLGSLPEATQTIQMITSENCPIKRNTIFFFKTKYADPFCDLMEVVKGAQIANFLASDWSRAFVF